MSLPVNPLGKTWKVISVKNYANHGLSGGWAQSLVSISFSILLPQSSCLLLTHFTEKQVGWHMTRSHDTLC